MVNVVLVNENDQPMGEMEKLEAHQKGLLHRAFSVLLYRRSASESQAEPGSVIDILLQQRAFTKYHCAGLFANTCCSHPMPGEQNINAAHRRLQEEVGISANLDYAGSFLYQAELDNGLIEHEFDHVFIGRFNGDIHHFNPDEVNAMRWVKFDLLSGEWGSDLALAPWVDGVLNCALKHISVDVE